MRGIADYEFLRQLGWGGRGRVFLCRRPPRLPVDVEYTAVKVFARESTSDGFRRASARLRSMRTVRSPYLATVYDVGQHDGVFYYAVELVPGGSLATPTHPVDPALRVRAVGDVARALSALHLSGIVHSGVKPANVLLDPYGAKLTDPDLTDIFTPGLRYSGFGDTAGVEFSDADRVLGAPPAPEHDIWSVGLLLQWVATGRTGYDDLSTRDGLGALRTVVSTRPRVLPTRPASLGGIVADCLAPAAQRPRAAVVADRIAAVAAEMAAV
jgi:serine/threonine protein kinase